MRVHELAKELGVTSKDLLAKVRKLGAEAKSHMSQIDEATVKALRGSGTEKKLTAKAPAKKTKTAKVAAGKSVKQVSTAHPVSVAEKPEVDKDKDLEEVAERKLAETAAEEADDSSAISLHFPITVGSLAEQLRMRIPEIIKKLMEMGIFANINQLLNEEIVFQLAGRLGISIKKVQDEAEKFIEEDKEEEDKSQLEPKPPVVTMMGHVDHGKTSLLDAIRKTNVAAKEKGFITQHIGAYGVDVPGKGHVTFLDTPGHEAFTSMRARGANVTDVVVLVVAADDGVMPQTVEAVDHAREAGCPIIVAVNKVDLPGANPQRVMTGLQKIGLVSEEWGGKTICAKVSAKTGQGVDGLIEMLLLEAEILELKANPSRPAAGVVIESHLSKGSGPVATVIIQKGTLHVGDIMISGRFMGRVRALKNDRGKNVKQASPAYAVEVVGLNGVPEAGESLYVVQDDKTARRITDQRGLEERERQMRGATKHLSLEELYQRISKGNFKELKLIIKADLSRAACEEALTFSSPRTL